jgi:hypothetical protein
LSRRLAPGRLVLATHNPGKIREIAALLGPFGMDVVAAGDLGLPEPEETGLTFAANAELKALAAATASGLPTIRACASTRSTARRESIRRAGPGRRRTSASQLRGSTMKWEKFATARTSSAR